MQMIVSCKFTLNASETSEGMMRRPELVPFVMEFLDRFQDTTNNNPYSPLHKIKDRSLMKTFKDLKYGAQALRVSLPNLLDMRVRQAHGTEEDFKGGQEGRG